MSPIPTSPLPASITNSLTPVYQRFEVDGRVVYARKLHGFEGLVCYMSETGNGFSQLSVGVATTFSRPETASSLLPSLEKAWIRTRHLIPGLGGRTFGIPKDDFPDETAQKDNEDVMVNKAHYLVYEVPQSSEEVEKWAKETIKFHANAGKMNLKEFDVALSQEWWKSGDGRLNVEFHVAEGKNEQEGEWLLGLHAVHHSLDGRGGFMVLDEILHFLVDELNGTASAAISSLPWGEEIKRLPTCTTTVLEDEVKKAAPAAKENVETENGEAAPPPEEKKEEPAAPAEPPVPFFRPYAPIPSPTPLASQPPVNPTSTYPLSPHAKSFPNVAHKYTLSRPMTQAFQKACKAHGRKITAVGDAILVLSEVEETVRAAAEKIGDSEGENKFKEIKGTFEKAAFVVVPLKFVDMRPSLPAHRANFGCPESTPLFSLNSATHIHGMQSVRDAFSVEDDGKITKKGTEKFWEGAVKDSADAWLVGRPSNEKFVAGEHGLASSLPDTFNPAQYNVPAIISSSTGDLDRMGKSGELSESHEAKLGLLGRWNPTLSGPLKAEGDKVDVRVQDVNVAVRTHCFPFLIAETFLYDGKFNFYCFGSAGFYTEEQMKGWANRIEGWVEEAIGKEEVAKAKAEEAKATA